MVHWCCSNLPHGKASHDHWNRRLMVSPLPQGTVHLSSHKGHVSETYPNMTSRYYINLMDNITQLYAAVCWFLFSTHCFKEAVPPHFTSDSSGLKAMLWAVRCSGIPGSSAVLFKPLDGLLMPLPSHSSLIFWPPISSPRIKSIAQSAYLNQINPNHSSFDAIGPFRQLFCYIWLP